MSNDPLNIYKFRKINFFGINQLFLQYYQLWHQRTIPVQIAHSYNQLKGNNRRKIIL